MMQEKQDKNKVNVPANKVQLEGWGGMEAVVDD